RKPVLAAEGSTKHPWIVSVERDHEPTVEIAAHGMVGQRMAASGAQIAGEADLDWNLANRELLQQLWVARGTKAVPDALSPQIERSPDGIGPGILARVRRQAKPVVGSPDVSLTKEFWRRLQFVAADSYTDRATIFVTRGHLEYAHRGFGPELTNGVRDPQKADTEVLFASHTRALQSFEDEREVLHTPKANPHRDEHFRMQNVFRL